MPWGEVGGLGIWGVYKSPNYQRLCEGGKRGAMQKRLLTIGLQPKLGLPAPPRELQKTFSLANVAHGTYQLETPQILYVIHEKICYNATFDHTVGVMNQSVPIYREEEEEVSLR